MAIKESELPVPVETPDHQTVVEGLKEIHQTKQYLRAAVGHTRSLAIMAGGGFLMHYYGSDILRDNGFISPYVAELTKSASIMAIGYGTVMGIRAWRITNQLRTAVNEKVANTASRIVVPIEYLND